MIVQALTVFTIVFVATYAGAIVSHLLFNGGATVSVQTVFAALLGYGALEYGLISTLLLGGVVIAPLGGFVLFYGIQKWLARRVREGKYGEESKWAAEIADSGDREFIIAMSALSSREMRDIGIIAESKQELRELTVERYEELSE